MGNQPTRPWQEPPSFQGYPNPNPESQPQDQSPRAPDKAQLMKNRSARLTSSIQPPYSCMRSTQQAQQAQQSQPTSSPLCCPSTLPHTLRHLATSIPSTSILSSSPNQQHTLGILLWPFFLILIAQTPLPDASTVSIPTFHPFIQLIQVSTSTPQPHTSLENATWKEARYFGLVTNSLQTYVEAKKTEAEISLKIPGSGAEVIGDGEEWIKLQGVERFWCEECGVWTAFRGWVRLL